MELSQELVRQLFLRARYWALPVGAALLTLCALVIMTDGPILAPVTFVASL